VIAQLGGLDAVPLENHVSRVALAAALGMFLGVEREWSQKSAGIRTFSLISLMGALFTILAQETAYGTVLLPMGGGLVILQAGVLSIRGLLEEEEGLSLTTSMSMLVTYGVGILVASDFLLVGVTVAVLSSLLLVLKRELHNMAWGLSRQELRSATEFAILAFVVYPLLPDRRVMIDQLGITVEPRVVWAMVVFVAGIGIVNYVVVMNYGGRGIAVTGFFGGLVSSTAVVGTMIDHVKQDTDASAYALAGILLSNAAMATRNLVIALGFTLTADVGMLYSSIPPLGVVAVGSAGVAAFVADWSHDIEIDLESPFSMRNALAFGGVFLLVVVANAVGEAHFGQAGILATAAMSGLVSSAGGTTAAVALYRTGSLGAETTVLAILLATTSSIAVKAGLTTLGTNKGLAKRVAAWSTILVVGGAVATVASSTFAL
jgi:uncharacterized membrane protein (DUF4010 family)